MHGNSSHLPRGERDKQDAAVFQDVRTKMREKASKTGSSSIKATL